jgi:colanic acid/amylovoran biosynthesis glycosyltransferase
MKLLIHAIDGVGLGHLVRTLEIAKAVLFQMKDVQIVFVTNSACPDLIIREGFKVYQLPHYTKIGLDDTISYDAYLRANYLKIRAMIKKEQPDIILMDSEFNSPLVNFCFENKIKTCFVLRNTTDQKVNYLCQTGFLDRVDLVLVPHNEEEIDPAQKNILLKHKNVHCVGPIFKLTGKLPPRIKDGVFRTLITFSAGADIPGNKELFSKVSDFLLELKKRKMRIGDQEIQVSIVAGPYFKEGSCDFHGFDHKKFEDDLPGVLAGCDCVVSPAGYNLINEIIATKTPALLVPAARKEDSQYDRARSLEDKGCAVMIKAGIWECLERLIKEHKIDKMRQAFFDITQGNTAAARRLIDLAQEKPKVLFLRAHWLPLSERFIYDELFFLRCYQPVVLCLHQNYKFEKQFEVLFNDIFCGLWHKDYPFIPKEKTHHHARMLQWAAAEIKARDIRILHAEFLSDAIFFMDLKRLSGLPLVVSVRGHDLYAKKSFDLGPIFAAADMFLVRSEIMKKDLLKQGCPSQKVIVQHSGIRPSTQAPFKRPASKETRLVMVGRLVEKKGTLFGINIFNQLCAKFNNLKLYIVGDGPKKNDVLRAVSQSPFASRIVFCGELPNDKVLELMKRCRLLLHPSITASDGDQEGVPGVIMEAMANGLVVVASKHGSISEIVEHKKTGILFKEADIDDAIEKLSFVIKNIRRLDALKDRALEKVRVGFNIIDETAKLEAVYDFVLKGKEKNKYERYYSNYQAALNNDLPNFFRADIHPVRGCNSLCIMCDNWKRKKAEFLPREKILAAIKELKNIGTKEIRFHGQEPTLRKDLPELIDHAKSLGLWVGLKTNCVGLTREHCKRLSKLDKLYVSIDSPVAAIHNKLRGNPGSFRDNIRVISYIKAENPAILVESNSVVTRLNYKSLLHMPSFAAKSGISKISFVLPNSKNKKDIAPLLLTKSQMKEFFFKIAPEIISGCDAGGIAFDFSPFFADLVLQEPFKMITELKFHPEKFEEEINNYLVMDYGKTFYERYGCLGPIDHASINYDGNVFPCCVVERKDTFAVGNILSGSFTQAWNSEKYAGIRKSTLHSRGKCCTYAASCASNFKSRKYLCERIMATQKPDEAQALSYIDKMAKFFFMKREDVDEIVRIKLKGVLKDASANCRFYKDRKTSQFLTKEDVRNNIHTGMISSKYVEHPGLTFDRTSGSAGDTVPYAYLRGFHRYARMIYPFLINTDFRWGDKYCVFTTLHCSRDRCSADNLPYYVNRVKIPTSDNIFMDKKVLERASSILKDDPEAIIHADPFYLCAVASYLDRKRVKLSLKGVSSTYELLTPSVKRYLEKIFNCLVFDSYGCSEFGPMAFACEHGAKHVFENSVFVEIVDKGRYLDPEVGEIVVTSLENSAMPLIRYRTGDLGKYIKGPCRCKRAAKRIEIYGRDHQCVSFKGVLYSERDIANLLDIPGVLLYQLIQYSCHSRESGNLIQNDRYLAFNILPENGYAGRDQQNRIKQEIKNRTGRLTAGKVSVNFTGHLYPEKSGKFKSLFRGQNGE